MTVVVAQNGSGTAGATPAVTVAKPKASDAVWLTCPGNVATEASRGCESEAVEADVSHGANTPQDFSE